MISSVLSLKNPQQTISYNAIIPEPGTGSTVDAFKRVLEQSSDNPDQYLAHLFNLNVFEPYIKAGPSWWREQSERVKSSDSVHTTGVKTLGLVADYMDAVTGNIKDPEQYRGIASGFDDAMSQFDRLEIAPIAKIVALDYQGLAYNKLAGLLPKDSLEQREALKNADTALGKCCELADKYDDPDLKLWEGFTRFNQARVNNQLGDPAWSGLMEQAIEIRGAWPQTSLAIPDDIRYGFGAECQYAKVFMASLDKTMPSQQVADGYADFTDWKKSVPPQNIRLTGAAENTWKGVLENRQLTHIVKDFDDCLRYTDAAIGTDPASDKASAWAQRLVEIAVNPEQSPADLAHRPFEAYVRQTKLREPDGQPTDQARAAGDKLLEIAIDEKDPVVQKDRLREAYYAQAVVQNDFNQVLAGVNLLELTKPGAITDDIKGISINSEEESSLSVGSAPKSPSTGDVSGINRGALKKHWSFMAPHVVSKIPLIPLQTRLTYAQQAEKNIVTDPVDQRDWQRGESEIVLESLRENTTVHVMEHEKSRGEKAREAIMQGVNTTKNIAAKLVCR